MNDYSGSLALQTIGVRVRRPISAVVVTVIAFVLILWLHSGDTASRFQNVLLLVSYWIPAFVAVVVIDWLIRTRGRATVNPAEEHTARADAVAAVVAFVLAYGAAVPFMNTSLFTGPVAKAWHGADIAYFVNFLVARFFTAVTGCSRSARKLGQVEPRGLVAAPLVEADRVGVTGECAEDQVVDAEVVQVRFEALEQF